MNSVSGDWMLFGGVALALHGLSGPNVADIDILASVAAVDCLADKFALSNQAGGASKRFRSTKLIRPNFGSIPVEIMGGFEVFSKQVWVPVDPTGYDRVSILDEPVNLASRARLRKIFELCGRDKDLVRAQLL